MPRLLSGSTLRRGGSGEFIDLKGAMPQLPPTETTATGFTLVTDNLLRTTYRSSLGFIEFNTATLYSSLPEGTIKVLATGSTFLSTGTSTGNLVVEGGVGVGGNMYIEDDIVVNGLTIGRGYEGINNIVIKGVAAEQINNFNNGQANITIGYDALQNIETSYRNIAIGRYALHSGTNLSNNIALGDSALKKIGYINSLPVADITSATNTNPVVITAINHGLNSGTYITITNVLGMTELNSQYFYIKKLSADSFSLYTDNILSSATNGVSFSSYISSGTVERILLKDNNIAIGHDSAKNLIDGEKNFFIGDGVGLNLTTGSNNFFIGHSVGNNITYGNNNIALGGDNLIDGLNDQVNIGSVFYYNGLGDLQLNADTEVGLGTIATVSPPGFIDSTSTFTGGLVVIGGLIVTENSILNKDVKIFSSTTSTSKTSGALVVQGGVGIDQNLYVGNNLNVGASLTVTGSGDATLSPSGANVIIQPELGGTVTIWPDPVVGNMDNVDIGQSVPRNARFLELTATIKVNVLGTENAISTNTGALTVAGGVGIGKDLWVGGEIYGPAIDALLAQTDTIYVNTASNATYYVGLTSSIGTYSNISSTGTFIYNDTTKKVEMDKLEIVSNLSNTLTNTDQSLVVNGGAYIGQGVYSLVSGDPNENNLVYTPLVYISATPPSNPRLGDYWIDPTYGVEFRYIQDGLNKAWIQFTGL